MKKISLTIIFILLCTPVYADITTGLLAWWSFDDASSGACTGTTEDVSGNSYNATCVGSPTWIPGKINVGAMSVNGTSQYINIPTSAYANQGLSSGTVAAWVYLISNSAVMVIENQVDGSNSYGIFSIGSYSSVGGSGTTGSAGVLYWHPTNSSTNANSTGTVGTGAWHHIAVTFSTTTVIFYIDGSQSGSTSGSFASLPANGSVTSSSVGAWPNNGMVQWYLDGDIDEVRIFNRALTSSDITQLYNYGLANLTAANFKFNNARLHKFTIN